MENWELGSAQVYKRVVHADSCYVSSALVLRTAKIRACERLGSLYRTKPGLWGSAFIMDATIRNASVTSAQVRTQAAYKNRWRNLLHNPKLLVIAFFAS